MRFMLHRLFSYMNHFYGVNVMTAQHLNLTNTLCSIAWRNPLRSWCYSLSALIAICLMVGCGTSVEAVPSGTASGKITFNGKPLKQGRINFVSATTGTGVYSELQEDGSYEMSGEIPAGDYRVFFTPPGLGDAPPSESTKPKLNDALKDLPKKYKNEQSSDLQVVIKEGENTFDFDLKP